MTATTTPPDGLIGPLILFLEADSRLKAAEHAGAATADGRPFAVATRPTAPKSVTTYKRRFPL